MTLHKKTALVTGAGSGIGLEMVHQLLSKDCRVIAADLNTETLLGLSSENLRIIKCDVSKRGHVLELLERAKEWEMEPEIFFANAGFSLYGSQDSHSMDTIETMWRVNYHAPIEAIRTLENHYPGSEKKIVITCSAMAFWGLAGYAQYSATKAALKSFVGVYRQEGNSQVHMVYPVATATSFFESSGPNTPEEWPIQSVVVMVKNTLSSLEKNQKNIFPYRAFSALLWVNRFVGFIKPIARRLSQRRYALHKNKR